MRLIDADALLEKVWDADTRAGYVQVVDRGDIESAPTIDTEAAEYLNGLISNIDPNDELLKRVCDEYMRIGHVQLLDKNEIRKALIGEPEQDKSPLMKNVDRTTFAPGDKFILEIGQRHFDEFKIAGTDYYIKISLLEKLAQYKPDTLPEVIHCKDCKFASMTKDGECKYCDIWFPDEAVYMDGDHFCASAERKNNETD